MNETNRFLALDAFRGMTIAAMILVNTPGSWSYVYVPLKHAAWHGCTPADLVFPFFLFIIGTAMWFSFGKFDHQGSPAALKKVLRRSVIIFSIGLVLSAFPFFLDFSSLRLMGVLQRIALAYGLVSLLCLYLNQTAIIIISGIVLIGYWLLLWCFGGVDPYTLENNLVRTIDLKIFGEEHLWKGTGIPFDPEGILSTLPAMVTVIIGYLTGIMIQSKPELRLVVPRMLLLGGIMVLLGLLWNTIFPINKSLWTSSYVLYTAGIAILILTSFIWLIDIREYKKWAFPFVVFGMNSLFIYILSSLWVQTIIYLVRFKGVGGSVVTGYNWLYKSVFVTITGNLNGSLLFAVSHIFAFWLLLLLLYKKRIFIKI